MLNHCCLVACLVSPSSLLSPSAPSAKLVVAELKASPTSLESASEPRALGKNGVELSESHPFVGDSTAGGVVSVAFGVESVCVASLRMFDAERCSQEPLKEEESPPAHMYTELRSTRTDTRKK